MDAHTLCYQRSCCCAMHVLLVDAHTARLGRRLTRRQGGQKQANTIRQNGQYWEVQRAMAVTMAAMAAAVAAVPMVAVAMAVEVLVCWGLPIVALATQELSWRLAPRMLVLPTRVLAPRQTQRAQLWLRATATPLLQILSTATQVAVPYRSPGTRPLRRALM